MFSITGGHVARRSTVAATPPPRPDHTTTTTAFYHHHHHLRAARSSDPVCVPALQTTGAMSYAAVVRAVYDYEATADDEITVSEDDGLYVLDNTDPEWWKVKRRAPIDSTGQPQSFPTGYTADDTGLVPATYVEPAEPLRISRALYDYAATAEEELSMHEEDPLDVYEYDGEWLLVKNHDDSTGRIGFVPANYVDDADTLGEAAARGGAFAQAPIPATTREEYQQPQEEYYEPEPAPAPPPPPPPPPAPVAVPTPPPPAPAVALPPPQRASQAAATRAMPVAGSEEDEDDDDAEYETGQISKPTAPIGLASNNEDTIKMWSVNVRPLLRCQAPSLTLALRSSMLRRRNAKAP